ncbi:MAG: ATP-binding cassette domain-containing protein [Pseudomonadota bacterium]
MSAPLLRCQALQVKRGAGFVLQVPALELTAGSITAVCGPNGSGKSSLLLTCAGLCDVAEGTVVLDDGSLHGGPAPAPVAFRQRAVLVLQDPYLLRGSVERNLSWGLGLRHVPGPERSARVSQVLSALALTDLARSDVARLSGGQRTAVAVARALVLRPELLLLDEVTRDLDAPHRLAVMETVRTLAAAGSAVLLATHDHDLVQHLAHRRLELRDGNIVDDAPCARPQQ